uniref:Uncharacterized protein n=1 Tax=Meloidogyne enterolobii TaxID=390850 RepID=A0A6V7VR99_MELEN|nr:unnamed protein product [Meloidogyne enterolobii]
MDLLLLLLLLILLYAQIIYSESERVTKRSNPSSEFIIRFEIASMPIQQPILLNDLNLSKRLETICALALERSLAKHLFGNDEKMDAVEALNDWRWWWSSTTLAGNKTTTNIRENEKNEQKNSEDKALENSKTKLEMAAESSLGTRQFRVRLLGIDRPKPWRRTFILAFAVFILERAIPAEVMVQDLSLLSLAEISAHLQLAVLRIDALVKNEMIEQTQWWLIGIIIGTGILIIGCCWAILFFWLNICVRKESFPQVDRVEAKEENMRLEEAVERQTSPTAPPLNLSQKVDEIENIPTTVSSRLGGRQNVCEDDLPSKTSLKSKQNLQEIKRNIIKDTSNTIIIKRRLPKILLKRKSLSKSWKSSQKRKIVKIPEEKAVNIEQQQIKENKKEEEAKQTAIEAPLTTLPPPVELEEALEKINKNNQQIPPTNWHNFQLNIKNYNYQQQYKINNRLKPYWVADKLENIFGIYGSSKKENPRPAPPSEYGEVRIVGGGI